MPPNATYTAQEIFAAYQESLALNALSQRRQLATIASLEAKVKTLEAQHGPGKCRPAEANDQPDPPKDID